jgi:hypothetical protein
LFDRVNHDQLMAKIAEPVSNKSLLKLIRAFLRAGVMLRSQQSRWRTGDEEPHAIHDNQAQAQSQRTEECGGRAMGAEVPGVQLHECGNTKAADRAESAGSLQGASPGADESDARCEHRAHGPWQLANSPALAIALPNAYFASLGIPPLTGYQ